MMKKCSNKYCEMFGIDQPIENFHKDKSRISGYRNICKKCIKMYREKNIERLKQYDKQYCFDNREKRSEYNKTYSQENKTKTKQRQIKYLNKRRIEHPEKLLYENVKRRARQTKMIFELELCDIFIPDRCPILDIPLFFSEGKKTDNTPSLDRIDNNKGYVKGNIRVISFRANALKSNMDEKIVFKLLQYIKGEI